MKAYQVEVCRLNYLRTPLSLVLWGVACLLSLSAQAQTAPITIHADSAVATVPLFEGIVFSCATSKIPKIRINMQELMHALGLQTTLVSIQQFPAQYRQKNQRKEHAILQYQLKTDINDRSTLDFASRPEFNIRNEIVRLSNEHEPEHEVEIVSQKEILMAMLQKGRVTDFSGAACSVEALRDQLGLRQNIVAWTTSLAWGWPDGESAIWHEKYWDSGTPRPNTSLDEALRDPFLNQDKYSIGCYTASKISYAHAILDYYQRIRKSPQLATLVRQRLMHDNEPLVNIEPAAMWSFEKDFDAKAYAHPGKLLRLQQSVAPGNFIPGDWVYIVNTDEKSAAKVGYEGSNAIYLGGGKFDDFYNDHEHSYTYDEKINEVYQWRHGVFNRVRDADKVQVIKPEQRQRLSLSPAAGGILFSFRATPYLFGYQTLPSQQ